MADKKLKTLDDLRQSLNQFGMDAKSIDSTLEVVAKSASVKYMGELYAVLSADMVESLQSMSKDNAAKIVHETFFEKTGKLATDRLDEIIHLTVEDLIANPAKFFQKKSE